MSSQGTVRLGTTRVRGDANSARGFTRRVADARDLGKKRFFIMKSIVRHCQPLIGRTRSERSGDGRPSSPPPRPWFIPCLRARCVDITHWRAPMMSQEYCTEYTEYTEAYLRYLYPARSSGPDRNQDHRRWRPSEPATLPPPRHVAPPHIQPSWRPESSSSMNPHSVEESVL